MKTTIILPASFPKDRFKQSRIAPFSILAFKTFLGVSTSKSLIQIASECTN